MLEVFYWVTNISLKNHFTQNDTQMNSRIKIISFLTLIVWGIVSCDTKTPLPESRGNAGEVIVIMDTKLWEGAYGDSIRHYLSFPVPAMTQLEPMLVLLQRDGLTNTTQQHRSVLFINIDPGFEKTTLTYKTNVYAQDQLFLNINTPSADSAIAFVLKNQNVIASQFLTKDRERYTLYYNKIKNKEIAEKLREKYQVDITIPREYSLNMEEDNFVWLTREEGDRVMGILMWKEPYTSQNQLDIEQRLQNINAGLKNVPGSNPDSYMATEPLESPIVKRYMKDSVYVVQINGLWQMENGFMGGPYTCSTIVDAKRGQLVTGLGFVFYPRREKREYIRQMEAIFYTMNPSKEQ